jgi:hypothetical protein
MTKQSILLSLIFLFFYAAGEPVFCDNNSGEHRILQWFETSSHAEGYREIQPELVSLFRDADDIGIPADLLLGKVKEGAAKGIPSSRLLPAVRNEKERLVQGLEIIENAGYSPAAHREELSRHLKLLGIILREGMSEAVLTDVLSEGRERGLDLREGMSACSAVFQIRKVTSLAGEDLILLGKALFESSLPPSKYASVSSIFLKAQVNRISERDILEIALRVFNDGGGLVQLEREFGRRGRRR